MPFFERNNLFQVLAGMPMVNPAVYHEDKLYIARAFVLVVHAVRSYNCIKLLCFF